MKHSISNGAHADSTEQLYRPERVKSGVPNLDAVNTIIGATLADLDAGALDYAIAQYLANRITRRIRIELTEAIAFNLSTTRSRNA